ncbi:Membrane protein involved in the export of O-antigen and teichoic acid [Flavobacterium urocaniciphilum]|uniref:Membrane protein involved in the export of O-antigen and teichoic acid n=2 Tax=Flavobacterium urocaniciphilum TaxID=1299341 RepID=A0A1H9BSL6_9FLAO|nr:Membrane protein involved in the export of O-antigen and teichoic acid [Flavobacterium urocaniciphilum]
MANAQIKKLLQYGIGQGFNVIAPFIVIPYIILKCGEENFGKSAIGLSVAFFIIVFIDFGCDILGVKDISINRDDIDRRNYIISRVTYIKAFFIVLSSIIFLIIIQQFEFFNKEKDLYYFSFSVFMAQIVNPLWIFQGLEKFNLFSYFSILSKSIYILLIFYFLDQKSDFIYINLAFGLSIFIAGVVFFLVLNKKYQFVFVPIKISELYGYMYENRTYVFSQIFIWMQLYSPILLVNYFGTSVQVGQFRIVDQIISIFKTYVLLSFNFIYPKICFEFDKKYNKGVRSWKLFNSMNFIFLSTLIIVLFVFSYEIINYYNILNKNYVTELLQTALIYPVIFFIVYAFKQLLLALHFEKIFSRIIIAMSILNLIIISLVYDKYSLFGVFYSFIFVEFITLLILIFLTLNNKVLAPKNKNYEV